MYWNIVSFEYHCLANKAKFEPFCLKKITMSRKGLEI